MDSTDLRSTQGSKLATPAASDLVDALNGTFGRHAGKRASHAKGLCAAGGFRPHPAAQAFVDSELFAETCVPAVVRFSVGGGNPAVSDKSRTLRGLAIHLSAPTESWDLVMASEPAFIAANPASFVSFLRARVPDPRTGKPDPAKITAHNLAHPDGVLQPALLAAHAAPSSYACASYYSNNAFTFLGRDGRHQAARLIARPVAGVLPLTPQQEIDLADDFLQAELSLRLMLAPVEFEILAELPAQTDSLVDPSKAWTGAGLVPLGLLRIHSAGAQALCDSLVFSPMTLPKAITPTNDPILAVRAASYAVSKARRANTV